MIFDWNPNIAVYGLIGAFDVLTLLFILAMVLIGKYGNTAPQEDNLEDGNS